MIHPRQKRPNTAVLCCINQHNKCMSQAWHGPGRFVQHNSNKTGSVSGNNVPGICHTPLERPFPAATWQTALPAMDAAHKSYLHQVKALSALDQLEGRAQRLALAPRLRGTAPAGVGGGGGAMPYSDWTCTTRREQQKQQVSRSARETCMPRCSYESRLGVITT